MQSLINMAMGPTHSRGRYLRWQQGEEKKACCASKGIRAREQVAVSGENLPIDKEAFALERQVETSLNGHITYIYPSLTTYLPN
mmetsp:Transcript_21566/g.32319  ORF Transcript_21566/g.32319 Transcript_21566/m.32319 type:complete len:84 (-) Transcript_21566:526-777(-)